MNKSIESQFVELYGKIHSRYGSNIKVSCPECGFKSLSCEINKGLRSCFHCGYGKGIKPLSGSPSKIIEHTKVNKELHILVIQSLIKLTKISESHLEYLASRGIYNPELYKLRTTPYHPAILLKDLFSDDDLINSGLFYKIDENLIASSVLKPNRILIPFWQGEKFITCKSRLRPYAPEDCGELRYYNAKGFNLFKNIFFKGKLGKDVIITEGELCAMACNQAGISSIGIPGLKGSRTQRIIQQINFLLEKYNVERVFIIFDSDPGIEEDRYKLEDALKLQSSLKREACILYLPQDKKTESMDLDLFLSRYEIDDLYNLMEDSWNSRDKLIHILKNQVKELYGRNCTNPG